jgi:hypothetical protein
MADNLRTQAVRWAAGDASLIKAVANRQKGVAGEKACRRTGRTVEEYLAAAVSAATEVPERDEIVYHRKDGPEEGLYYTSERLARA